MKRIIFAAVLMCIAFTVSSAKKIAEGKTFSAMGDYKIELADNKVILNGKELKAYRITYANVPMEVTVAVKKKGHNKTYLVLSEKLSVQYVCNNSYFGVQRLDSSIKQEGSITSDENLNRAEFFHQKVLGPAKDETETVRSIAAYFPHLFKDAEEETISK